MASEVKVKVTTDTKQSEKALKSLGATSAKVKNNLGSIGSTISTGIKAGAVAAAAAIAGLGAALTVAVNKAADFESINTQFEVLVGNTEDAAKAVKSLAEFSGQTPFQFEDIAAAGKTLLGFGFDAGTLTDNMKRLGDVASASGTPLKDLALIFGQVSAAGKLTGERLLQLQERAIPIGPAIAKTMGIAEKSVRAAVSAGKVDFETFEKAFNSISDVGGKAFNGMEKQSQTLQGRISTLKDNFDLLAAGVGKELLPIIKNIAKSMTTFIRTLTENKDAIATFAKDAIGFLARTFGFVAQATIGATKTIFEFKNTLEKAFDPSDFRKKREALTIEVEKLKQAFRDADVDDAEGQQKLVRLISRKEKELETIKIASQGEIDEYKAKSEAIASIETGLQNLLNGLQQTPADVKANEDAKLGAKKKSAEEEAEFTQEKADAELLALEEQLIKGDTLRADFLQSRADLEARAEANSLTLRKATIKSDTQLNTDYRKKQLTAINAQAAAEIEADKNKKSTLEKANAFFRSKEISLAQGALANIATLQNSGDKKLFAIGKAAATANAIVNIAQGATKGLAQGGILGPVYAASVIAAGAVQLATIAATSFASGGLVEGGVAGKDSVPIIAQRGEVVTPRQNFEEVIGSVRAQREAEKLGTEGTQGPVEIMIGFTDDAFEIIENKLLERGALGIGNLA
jgi:tape measure domain-containing protein